MEGCLTRIEIAIYGAGGFGREVAWLAEEYARPVGGYRVIALLDDNPANQGREINGFQVMSLESLALKQPQAKIALAIGKPATREKLAQRCKERGFEFVPLIHELAEISRWVEIGPGAVICGGCILTTNIRLGEQVQINLDCTIGHDVVMGDYTTLAPGVHVSGWVHMGKRVYVGTGAVFVNGTEAKPLLVGDEAVIGAGACVTKDVPPGTTVVGVPARPMKGP